MTDSVNSLKEIMDQSSQANTSPIYGTRTLDLGSIYPNASTPSNNPLLSNLNGIPSYQPPPQQGPVNPTMPDLPSFGPPKSTGGGPPQGGMGKINLGPMPGFGPPLSSPSSGYGTEVTTGTGTGYGAGGGDYGTWNSSQPINPLVSGPDTGGSIVTTGTGSSVGGAGGFDYSTGSDIGAA